jgi:hypothetical protein
VHLPRQRIVDRLPTRRDCRHEIVVDREPPKRGAGIGRHRDEVPDTKCVMLKVRAFDELKRHSSDELTTLIDRAHTAHLPGLLGLGRESGLLPPAPRPRGDIAEPRRPRALVQRSEVVRELLAIDEGDARSGLRGSPARPLRIDRHARRRCRGCETVAAVDRRL